MEQVWFEMRVDRQRRFDEAVWIPLLATDQIQKNGTFGYEGYISDFFGAKAIAFPVEGREQASKLGWMEIGISNSDSGYVDGDEYIPSDIYKYDENVPIGLHLALDQHFNSHENREWHLHQDFVTTLGLKREGDAWVRPNEGYIEIAKLKRRDDGKPCLLTVRASHLKDYLCARGMALYISSYRGREEITDDCGNITWGNNSALEGEGINRWEGHVIELHEGGMPYGGATAVFHLGRKNVDFEKDVPSIKVPDGDEVVMNQRTIHDSGRKLFLVEGRLWRTEWVEPAHASPIVRGDKLPSSACFIINAEGEQRRGDTLVGAGNWLWFRPEVVSTLLGNRGAALEWGTRDTGRVGCSPDYKVDFGVNELGLVNVYAKDIGLLPEWQQKIWAGFNQGPEGGVSRELLTLQAEGSPVATLAPESFLRIGLSKLVKLSMETLNLPVLHEHDSVPGILDDAHRFRAIDVKGLLALAKDLDRLTVERINKSALRKKITPPPPKDFGSLKVLENLVAMKTDTEIARNILAPLVGIHELRLADAHLPPGGLDSSYKLAEVDQTAPYVTQGFQLLHACVSAIYNVCRVLKDWNNQG